MIRKNQNQSAIRPLYRHVVRDAWKVAWQEKKLWFFALFAALLQTGGVLDVFIVSIRRLGDEASGLAAFGFAREFFGLSAYSLGREGSGFWGNLQMWEGILFGTLFVFTMVALSVVAQGALIAGIGARIRGRALTARECFSAGLATFGPVALLNVFTLGLIRLSRFVILLPLSASVRDASAAFGVTAVLAGFLFFVVTLVLTVVHVYALNALVLEGVSLREAIVRGFDLLRRTWLMTLESAFLLLVIGFLLLVGGLLAFFLMSIPVLSLLFLSMLVQAPLVAVISQVLLVCILIVTLIAVGSFSVIFQYAVWHEMYRRSSEGGVMAKLHRWAKWITGDYQATKI